MRKGVVAQNSRVVSVPALWERIGNDTRPWPSGRLLAARCAFLPLCCTSNREGVLGTWSEFRGAELGNSAAGQFSNFVRILFQPRGTAWR